MNVFWKGARPMVAALGILVMLSALATPAFAIKPSKSTVNESFTIDDFVFPSCSYGPLPATITFTGFANCHQDQAGNCSLFFHIVEDVVVTNPLSGKIATGSFTWNETLTANTLTTEGGSIDLNVAGMGKVAHASGKITFDANTFNVLFITPQLQQNSSAAICAALQ
jgi:hypothetical protein